MALQIGMFCLPICFALLCDVGWTTANKGTSHDSRRLLRAQTSLVHRPEGQKMESASFSRLSLKKLLKRKRRKLKRLSHEINTLKQHLNDHSKRAFNNDSSSAENSVGRLCKKRRKAVDSVWKKKIEGELVLIHGKLSRINSALKKSYKIASQNGSSKTTPLHKMARLLNSLNRQRLRGNSQSKAGRFDIRHGLRPSDLLVSSTAAPFAKKPLIFDLSMKKYGNRGSVCKNHRQCKPGLCCHDDVPTGDFPSTNGSVCVQHGLKEGQSCLDSCQCELGLNCFRGRSTAHVNSENDRSAPSQCKIASMDDVLLGEYVTDRDSVFHGAHRTAAEHVQV
uniref:Dickkopf N-terminal cysteine-rich domain-containing protein n=1 Tax=Trichuris muris TaxID=70415 RepID=A0A5S6Q9A1_TRIMR